MAAKLVDKVLGFMGFEEEEEGTKNEQAEVREEPRAQWNNRKKEKATVFNLHAQKPVRVIVAEPRTFDEAQGIADNLKNRCPVIVNLEQSDADLAKRVVDFVSGACYALNGSLQKVGSGIFLFVPNNMDINNDIKSISKEREKEKIAFPWIVNK